MAAKKGFNLADVLKGVPRMDTDREQLEYIDIDLIEDDPKNFYSLSGLDDLADNIALVGLQQPLLVRPDPGDPARVIIVSGHRRRAAIRRLVDEGREDLRRIKCIREQTDEPAEMQELKLIFANSSTRVLTDAELSRQAERVEMLFYRLKDAGYDFPGRMRDHVAEACNVAKSKLARLKVIREGLAEAFKDRWEAGTLTESAAYELARMPEDLQTRICKVCSSVPDAVALGRIQKLSAAGPAWPPELKCPDGRPCTHADSFLRHSIVSRSACETCCLKCSYGAQCSSGACDRMCSTAKNVRKTRLDLAKEKAACAERKRLSDAQRKTVPFARRVAAAADAAGLKDTDAVPWDRYGSYGGSVPVKTIREWAEGRFSDEKWYYPAPRLTPESLSCPLEAAKVLKCSADYLLGLTDNLHPASAPEPAYIFDRDPEGPTDALALFDLGDGLDPYCARVRWDGCRWTFPYGVDIEGKCTGWYPIPPMPASDAREEEN